MTSQPPIPDSLQKPLSRSLLLLRLGIFVVLLMWTLDKFVNPAHASKVLNNFYGIDWLTHNLSYIVGSLELLLILAFVVGLWRRWTYAIVLIIHAFSTFSPYKQYMAPFDHLLFFTAWPMLAACLALYWLREWDTLCTIPQKTKTTVTS